MEFSRTTTARQPLLEALYTLADRIRDAATPSELLRVEEDIDAILRSELAKHAHGDASAADAGALNLATRRLEHLINHRRSVLASAAEQDSSKKLGPVRVNRASTLNEFACRQQRLHVRRAWNIPGSLADANGFPICESAWNKVWMPIRGPDRRPIDSENDVRLFDEEARVRIDQMIGQAVRQGRSD